MKTLEPLLDVMLPGLKPFSTNDLMSVRGSALAGRWKRLLAEQLPDAPVPSDLRNHTLHIEVAVQRIDLDNSLKVLIDALELRYGFNDETVGHIAAVKHRIDERAGEQPYIRVRIVEAIQVGDGAPMGHFVMEGSSATAALNELSRKAGDLKRGR